VVAAGEKLSTAGKYFFWTRAKQVFSRAGPVASGVWRAWF